MKLSFNTSELFQSKTAEKYLTTILPRLQEKKVQSFTTLTLTLITIAFFGLFAISPTLSTITDLQKQISDSEFVNESLQTKITNLTALQESYIQIKPDLPFVLNAIPQQPQLALFVSQVQAIGQLSNVQISQAQTLPVDIGDQPNPTKYTTFAFSLDVTGTHDGIFTFLNKLTSYNRLIGIDILSLTNSQNVQGEYRVNIRGKAFFKTN